MQEQPTPQTPNFNMNRIWWIVMGFLILWNIWLLIPSSPPQATIPYSTFLDQVQAGNVAAVQIAGDQITGQFVQPIAWPPAATPAANATPSSANTPSATAASTTAASTTAANPTAAANATTSSASATTGDTYDLFNTTFPATVGDPTLLPLLADHQVLVNVTQPPTPWFSILLTDGLPILLLVLVMVWLGRRAAKSQSGLFSFGRTKSRVQVGEHPDVTFVDVAGADEVKLELQEVIDFLRSPSKYHDLGARIPRGVLLVGKPGTGKTLLARAVAGEADVPFFNISASEFVEMFVGVGASRVRDLFKQAKDEAPAIVFINELDAVGRRRGAGLGTVNDEREQTLNQLLVEMDGFDEHHEVIVMAATNRPDVLDPALLRPGRFDRQITVGLPDQKGRAGILRIHTRHLRLSTDVNLGLIARATTSFSGADLANLCNEAALTAARHARDHVTPEDFEEAQDRILLGEARPLVLTDQDRRTVAYHESGHALVAWLLPAADPVHKVTIIPHGQALGVTAQMPDVERYNFSHAYLEARLAVMLGGRTSEEVALGDITTGAENDLQEATHLARRMVTRWGMSELGLVAFDTDEEQPFLGYELAKGRNYSETTAARIDEAVETLLAKHHALVTDLLRANRDRLDALANTLLKEETIEEAELERILGPRPTHQDSVELPQTEALRA